MSISRGFTALLGLLIASIQPSWAFQYQINPESGEIWAFPEKEESWDDLKREWGKLLDFEIVSGNDGSLPSRVALHNILHPFIREWNGKKVEPTAAQREDMRFKPEEAPNCFSTVLSVYDPTWRHAFIGSDDFLKRFQGSGAWKKVDSLTPNPDIKGLKPGDVLHFYYTVTLIINDPDGRASVKSEELRHAAIYLTDGILFEKQNLNFNSPHEMIPLMESIERAKGRATGGGSAVLERIEVWRLGQDQPRKQNAKLHKNVPTPNSPGQPKLDKVFDGKETAAKNSAPIKAPLYATPVPPKPGMPSQKQEEEIQNLKSVSAEVRKKALLSLRQKETKEAAKDVAALLKDPDPSIRSHAAMTLGEFRAKDYAKSISALLKDPDTLARRAAIYALKDLNAKEYASEIASYLKDDKYLVRKAAIETLGAFKAKEYAQTISGFLGVDEPLPIRLASIQALVDMEAHDSVQALEEQIRAHARYKNIEYDAFHEAALKAIGKLNNKTYSEKDEQNLRNQKNIRIAKAALYIVKEQTKYGGWSTPMRDRALGGTALAVEALQGVLDHSQSLPLKEKEKADIAQSVKKGLSFMRLHSISIPEPNSDDKTPMSLGFSLSVMAKNKAQTKEEKEDQEGAISAALQKLSEIQKKDGSFGYLDHGVTFQTASVIISLLDLKQASTDKETRYSIQGMLEKAAAALEFTRGPDGLFPYYMKSFDLHNPGSTFNKNSAKKRGAAARSVVCDYALYRYKLDKAGKSDTKNLKNSIQNFQQQKETIENVISVGLLDPHTGPEGISDYYYVYALMNLSRALKETGLGTQETYQEIDGKLLKLQTARHNWETSVLQTSPVYDTAMAILSLLKTMPTPAAAQSER